MKKFILITIVGLIFLGLVIYKSSNQEVITTFNSGNGLNSNPNLSPNPTVATNQTNNNQTPQTTAVKSNSYKNGTFTGQVADAYYGNVQVETTINSGKLTEVKFLQYPNDNETSLSIAQQAMPILISEAITNQTANVDVVSGASATSGAFQQSLQSALNQALQ